MAELASAALTGEQRRRLAELLLQPKYELIPLSNVMDQVRYLPEGATVTVTASPSQGMAATMGVAVELAARGFKAVPHLSARLIRDEIELGVIVEQAASGGLTEAFVVGGDAQEPGVFFDGLALLEAMQVMGHPFQRIGFPGYPEGHPVISETKLQRAVHDKAPSADFVTTQMCFDDVALIRWVLAQRADGVTLPVVVGIPGVAAVLRLARIATRIGVGDSARFLSSNIGLLGKLVRPGGYAPDELLAALGSLYVDPAAGISGFHIYTFNQVETTERWRQEFLSQLA